jgi:hypothetical protein
MEVEIIAGFISQKYKGLGREDNSCAILSISLHSFLITAVQNGKILVINGMPVVKFQLCNVSWNLCKQHTYNVFYCGEEMQIMTIDLSINQFNDSTTVKDGRYDIAIYTPVDGNCRLVSVNELVALNIEEHGIFPEIVPYPICVISESQNIDFRYRELLRQLFLNGLTVDTNFVDGSQFKNFISIFDGAYERFLL